ncbi:histidine--tRNA ligase [Solicola sp. PLA-1-18]|uniref:histidine--tRNA ligase n=1 Tax=Solicola sp. PLA-1-18 TaxID=3380532 RepID=UPI003B812BE6
MSRPTPLSGFPELLPSQRAAELAIIDSLRETFELHGFASLETRFVEPLDQLLRKGETSNEVYVLRRLHAEDDGDSGMGLHFDLTVPLARYVLEHQGDLHFPFRRYQIQRCWRGERPQEGRYREFTQADIDIIGRDTLSFDADVEVTEVMAEALSRLPVPALTLHVNNRKLIEGFYRGIGVDDPTPVIRAVDKLDKIGPDGVAALLAEAGLDETQTRQTLALAQIRSTDTSFADEVRALGVEHPLLDEGLRDLVRAVEAGARSSSDRFTLLADLSIARGLDYYTGTVFEGRMETHGRLSICAGGRYDALAADGRSTYPGVGISLGVTRLVAPLVARGLLDADRSVPSAVLVAVLDEDARAGARDVARALRGRGIPTEVAPDASRLGKQIRHADRRGIPYVWFPSDDGHQVKDIRSGDQVDADPATWTPPAVDLRPRIVDPSQPAPTTEETSR